LESLQKEILIKKIGCKEIQIIRQSVTKLERESGSTGKVEPAKVGIGRESA
jgi:hypothetical protein